MSRIPALAGIAALALPLALAVPSPAQTLPPTLELTYTTYAAGFTSLVLIADLTLTPAGYRLSLAYRTVGAIGFFLPGQAAVTAVGTWRHDDGQDDEARPSAFSSIGAWGGHAYDVEMDYPAGAPEIRRLVPTQADRREPVPAPLRQGTIDTASAIALLMHRMVEGESCAMAARVFDGRRLMVLTARPAGTALLAPTTRSFFHGPAIRCDITGKLLAGFLRSDGPAERARLRRGAVWFAHPVPGLPLLPVRIAFDNRWFSAATMYLTDVTAGPKNLPPVPAALAEAPADPPRAPAAH